MSQSELSRIDHIIDVARGAAPSGPSERENREATRIPYQAQVALIQIAPSGDKMPPVMFTSENISMDGLCLVSAQEMSVGTRGAVMIMKSDGESVLISARIVYANSRGPNVFECGVQFENEPTVVTMDDFRDAGGNMPMVGPAKAA